MDMWHNHEEDDIQGHFLLFNFHYIRLRLVESEAPLVDSVPRNSAEVLVRRRGVA